MQKAGPAGAFAPLRDRNYRIYWLTGISANFGWLIQMVGASWLMVSLGGSPEMVALVQTALALPVMVFALPAGAAADALGRRTVVIWSQAFLLVVSTLLAILAYLGLLTPWLLLTFTFLVGSGRAMNNPGWTTRVTELVPRADLPSAIALNSVGFNLARSLGPAIGGAIVATVGAFAAFAVNAASNLGVLLVALRWPRPVPDLDHPPEPIARGMIAGVRHVAQSRGLRLILLRAGAFNVAAISMMALMPLIARDLIGGGARTYGILLGAFGLGAVAGAMAMGRLRHRLSLEYLVRIGFLVFAAALAITGASGVRELTFVAAGLAGVGWLVMLSSFSTSIQMSAPRWLLSRCQALFQTVIFGGNAIGSWLWGEVAGGLGIPAALFISAAALVLGAAIGLVLPLRDDEGPGAE